MAYHKCAAGKNIDFCYHCWRDQSVLKNYFKSNEEIINFMNSIGNIGGPVMAHKPHGLLPNEKNRTLRASRLLMEYEIEKAFKMPIINKFIDLFNKSKFPYRWKYEDLKKEITKEFF